MILKQLVLSNYRRYRSQQLIFNDGITGIVGKNGAGKSSILEAILWCLYGNRAARSGKDGIKHQDAEPSETCEVSLTFILNGVEYCLIRSLIGKSNKTETKLTQQGRIDAVTTREVDSYIVKLLGLNLKGFLSSFFARQKELNALTDARPAERRNHLARMLGVGRLDNAIDELKSDIKMNRKEIDVLEVSRIDTEAIEKALVASQENLADIEVTISRTIPLQKQIEDDILLLNNKLIDIKEKQTASNTLEKEEIALHSQLESLKSELDSLKSEIEQIDTGSDRLTSLKNEVSRIQDLEKQHQDLIQAQSRAQERQQILSEISIVKNKYSNILKEVGDLQKQVTDLAVKIAPAESVAKELDDLRIHRENLLNKHSEADAPISGIKQDIAKLKKQKEQIDNLGPEATCEFCLRPFGNEFTSIEQHFSQELLSLDVRLKPLIKAREAIASEGKTVAEQIRELDVKNKHINKLVSEHASGLTRLTDRKTAQMELADHLELLNNRLEKINDVGYSEELLASVQTELEKLREANNEYIRLSERASRRPKLKTKYDVKNNSCNKLEKDYAAHVTRREKIGFKEEDYSSAQSGLNENSTKLSDNRLTIERLLSEKKLLEKDISLAKKQLADDEKTGSQLSNLRVNLQYQEKLSILFADFRTFLIGRIRPALSRQTTRLFHEMTSGRYQEVELDEDYNLCLYDNGKRFPIDRFSGGEIDLANLCFRLAISIEMASTAGIDNNFIILDEIFGSQDSERQRLIIEGLSRLKNRFRQIIIVSHIEDVKELSENIIEIGIGQTGESTVKMTVN